MRLSVEENDPGYSATAHRVGRDSIKLNGQVVHEVITADEEQGFVKLYAWDETGGLKLDGDRLATEIHRGRVEITIDHDS